MRNTVKLILAAISTIAVAASCTKDIQTFHPSSSVEGEVRELVFDANIGSETRTSVNPSTGSSIWNAEGESVKVANLAGNAVDAAVTRSETDYSKALIQAAIAESSDYLAFSPASSYSGVIDANGILAKLPSIQDGKLTQYMTASTTASAMSFSFKNVGSVLRLSVGRSDVRKVVFSSFNGDVVLTGDNLYFSAVTGDYLTDYEETFGGEKSVTLDPGALLAADTDYFLTVASGTLASGFKITLYGGEAGDQCMGIAEYASSFQLKRNTIINLGKIDAQVHNTISNAAELQEFLNNSGSYPSTLEFSFTNDIDLSGVTITSGENLTCILNGAGYCIKNWTTAGVPLLAINSGIVKNLTFDSSCTASTPESGGMFGLVCARNTGTLENCTNNANVTVTAIPAETKCFVGSLVGKSEGYLKDCTNNGSITASTVFNSSLFVGGIAGQVHRETPCTELFAENCTNTGAISLTTTSGCVKNTYIGGIIGGTVADAGTAATVMNNYGDIKGCTNSGNLSLVVAESNKGSYTNFGGIIGYAQGRMISCSNSGDITLDAPYQAAASMTALGVGGLCGRLVFGAQNCTNSGKVSVKGTFANGTSLASGTAAIHSPCVGGLFGVCGGPAMEGSENVTACSNTGSLDLNMTMSADGGTSSYVGGIVAYTMMPVVNCVFEPSGSIKTDTMFKVAYVGGISGYAAETAPVSGCYFNGAYTVNFDISFYNAAKVPELWASAIVCYPKANVTDCHVTNTASFNVNHNYKAYVGAIASNSGSGSTTAPVISNCSNAAPVNVNVSYLGKTSIKQCWVGGLLGYTENTTISSCTNTGAVSVTGNTSVTSFDYAGGIVGNGKKIKNCIATCNVISQTACPMRVGLVAGSCGACSGCTATGTVTMSKALAGTSIGAGKQSAVGGIAGHCSSTVTDCSFSGTVVNDSAQDTSTGGFIGTIGDAIISHSGCTLNADIQSTTATTSNGIWIGGQLDALTAATEINLGTGDKALEIVTGTKFLGTAVTAADLVKEKLIGYLSPTAGEGSGSAVTINNVVMK